MASAHEDRLRRAYELFNTERSLDWDLFDPAIQHDQTEGLFLDGVFYGQEGIRAALVEIEEDWEGLHLEPEDVIDLGDRLLVLVRMTARVRGSEAEIDAQVAHVWEFRGDRAVRWAVYGDRASAMRALSAPGPFGTAL
jgi:ketosteroid isomerase-like protein